MASPTPTPAMLKAAKEAFDLLEKQAELQQQVNKGITEYFGILKDIDKTQKNIDFQTKNRNKEREKADAARKAGDLIGEAAALAAIKLLDEEIKKLGDLKKMYVSVAKEAKTGSMTLKLMFDGISKLPSIIDAGYGKLKSFGLFDMDKSMKSAALEMGILSQQTDGFRKGIFESVTGTDQLNTSTLQIGIGIEEMSKMQAEYSSSIGRSVQLTEAGRQAMADLAKGTMLGVDGAAQLVGEFDKFGKSAESTKEFMEDAMNSASKLGLNAGAVTKNIVAGVKLLNTFNFKDGAKGMEKMAEQAAKYQTSMTLVSGMAEKLFDIEGAVEMSAQLQVLGGEWAKLGDPFKLMYMARNDMAGLNEAVINATKSTAVFNKTSGNFEIPTMELQRLRKVAEQTGLNYDALATAAKKAAEFTNISNQLNVKVDDDTQKFISSVANLDDKGTATITLKGGPKLVSALDATNLQELASMQADKKSLNERAKQAIGFDESLTNFVNMFKTSLLPIIDGINTTLGPILDKFFKDVDFKKNMGQLGESIGNFIIKAKGIFDTIGNIVSVLGPGGTLALLLGAKGLMSAVQWFTNGQSLGMGFNAVASAGGGGVGAATSTLGKVGRIAGGGLAGAGIGAVAAISADSAAEGAGNIIGGAIGAAALSFIPIVGTIAGGMIGSYLGGMAGKAIHESGTNDGIFSAPVHDGSFPGVGKDLGSDFSKGRGILQGGKITPIDNKDDLIAAKPRGVIDTAMKNNTNTGMNVSFDDIKLSGNIKLDMPGNGASIDISNYLLNNQDFIKDITRMVHVQTSKAINGGKISGQPAN